LQFITLEGINSGVPTRTTPTLTPTTLRSIEQTFIELQSKPESHENEAGFVPPLVHSIGNNQYISASDADIYSSKSQNMWQNSLSQSSSDSNTRSTPPLTQKTSLINNTPSQTRRNMGGRKPTKDLNISPEEEERRRIRRERNKAAAARCRKRRVDHTNSLVQVSCLILSFCCGRCADRVSFCRKPTSWNKRSKPFRTKYKSFKR
jgi:fos-like antigen